MRVAARAECKLCGSVGRTLYSDLHDRLFSAPGTWELKQCSNAGCGLIWLDPEPREEDVPLLYKNYYTHPSNGRASILQRALHASYRTLLTGIRIRKERQKLQKLFVDELPPGGLLEVGCGSGKRLRLFKALGWRVTGQDIDPMAGTEARDDIEVHIGPLDELAHAGRRFDAIVINHVLEHVIDPVALLALCRRMLRPRGSLVCVTPNAASWGHRHFGRSWMSLDPPRHLSLFTPAALDRAARMAGYQAAEIRTSCANVETFALGSVEIAATGRYNMGRVPGWRSHVRAALAQVRALREFVKNASSGDELILRCQAP